MERRNCIGLNTVKEKKGNMNIKFFIVTIFLLYGCFKCNPAYSQIPKEEINTIRSDENCIKGMFRKKIALLIGVHNPPPDLLEYTTNDVENLGKVLADEFGYEIKKIIERDATKNKILMAFDNLVKETRENDQVIIFFSGHGIRSPTNPGVGFLFPSDGDKNNLLTTAINMSAIQTLSKTLRAKHFLFVIDSCYSGIAGYYKGKDITLHEINMVKYFIENKARQVLTAGKAGERVHMDTYGKKMSFFTYYLKKGLTRKPDNYFNADLLKNDFITIKELYIYVQKEMLNESIKQHPEYYDYQGTQADFVFIPRLAIDSGSQPPGKTGTVTAELPIVEEKELQKVKIFLPQLNPDLSNVGSTLGKISAEMNFDDKKVVSGLLQLLNDPDPLTRWRAAMLLFRSKETRGSELLQEKIAKALIDTGDKIDNSSARQSIIQVLVRLHIDEAQDLLLHLAKSDININVRRSAILGLKKIGKDEKTKEDILVYIMNFDDNDYVQQTAMETLAELYHNRAIEEILPFLSAPFISDNILNTAIRLAGELKAQVMVGPLLNILKTSSNSYTIDTVVNTLIKIDDERAFPTLIEMMNRLSSESYPEKSTKEKISKYLEKKK